MQGLWEDAIDRLLDLEQTKVGSMDSLLWHQAEMMIFHLSLRQPGPQNLKKAFEILERLAQEAASNPVHSREKSYNAWQKMDIYLVHAILKSWNQLFRKRMDHTRPSIVCERIERCLEISKGRLFEPNVVTYTIILDGAAHCPDPKERLIFSEDLLARLIVDSEENAALRPTAVTFGTVIHAFAKSGSVLLAEKAEGLLRRLQQLHESGWPDVEPNTIMYTQVIHGWANVGEAERAEALLQEMYRDSVLHGKKNVLPSLWTFNSVLAAWSKSNDPRCISFAEILLRKMIDFSKDNDSPVQITPNMISYNCMLSTIARRRKHKDSLKKAEFWMEELLEFSRQSKTRKNATPTRYTYNTLFNIIAFSGIPDKAERARFWLEQSVDPKLMNDKALLQRIHDLESNSN
jgi:pentatricopeptide repeat protein